MITLTTEQAHQIEEAEQEPVAFPYHPCTWILIDAIKNLKQYEVLSKWDQCRLKEDAKWKSAPVRTKDLTDDEIVSLINSVWFLDELMVAKVNFARAVIAADREKNK